MSFGATGRVAGLSGKGLGLVGWGRTTWERAWSSWNGARLGPNGTGILRRAAMGQRWESVRKGLWSGQGSWSSWDQAAVCEMRLDLAEMGLGCGCSSGRERRVCPCLGALGGDGVPLGRRESGTESVCLEGPGDRDGVPRLATGTAPCCPAAWDWQECQQELLYQQW